MSSAKNIITISSFNEFKFKEKGSLFIGHAFPFEAATEAENKLVEIKKHFYDATHNCFAYNISDGTVRYSDDGEPNGTAGIRILNAIEHFGLTNLLVVVTRYFGGVKLGVGPLGKAYYNAAFSVLESAEKKRMDLYQKIKIIFDYDLTSHVHHFINKYRVKSIENQFETKPVIKCLINPENISSLRDELKEISKGKIEFFELNETFFI